MATSELIGIRGLDKKLYHDWRELVIAERGNGKRRGKHSIVAVALNEYMQEYIRAHTRTDPAGDPLKPLKVHSKRDAAGLERVKKRTDGTVEMLLEEFDQTIKDAWGVRDERALENLRPMVMEELGAKVHPANPRIIELSSMHR